MCWTVCLLATVIIKPSRFPSFSLCICSPLSENLTFNYFFRCKAELELVNFTHADKSFQGYENVNIFCFSLFLSICLVFSLLLFGLVFLLYIWSVGKSEITGLLLPTYQKHILFPHVLKNNVIRLCKYFKGHLLNSLWITGVMC